MVNDGEGLEGPQVSFCKARTYLLPDTPPAQSRY